MRIVSFSGYQAYTPTQLAHVFDVHFDPATGTATWTDVSHNIGDQPVTDVAFDDVTGDLYASTDFGIPRLPAEAGTWVTAANGLPPVATYALTIAPDARELYEYAWPRSVRVFAPARCLATLGP